MALAEFWNDVRERTPMIGDGAAPPDAPRLTDDDLDVALGQNEQRWWIHGRLKGYDEKDFDFLPVADREQLSGLVKRFNDIAQEFEVIAAVPPAVEVRVQELKTAAIPLLRDIALLLGLDRYFSWEALRYGKLVERQLEGKLPSGVVELRFLVQPDWSGDPGFYAWAFIAPEDIVTDEKLFAVTRRARPLIEDAMYRVAKDHFAYLSFRGVGEKVAEDEDEEVAA